jgi:hypothetical protein
MSKGRDIGILHELWLAVCGLVEIYTGLNGS